MWRARLCALRARSLPVSSSSALRRLQHNNSSKAAVTLHDACAARCVASSTTTTTTATHRAAIDTIEVRFVEDGGSCDDVGVSYRARAHDGDAGATAHNGNNDSSSNNDDASTRVIAQSCSPALPTLFREATYVDRFARARVVNFVRRYRGSSNNSSSSSNSSSGSDGAREDDGKGMFEVCAIHVQKSNDNTTFADNNDDNSSHAASSSSSSLLFHGRVRVPLRHADYADCPTDGVWAHGVARDAKTAELLAAMHAEQIIDALGYHIHTLPSMQRRHAEAARRAGRSAPLPDDGDVVQTLALADWPPPLRHASALDESEGGKWQLLELPLATFTTTTTSNTTTTAAGGGSGRTMWPTATTTLAATTAVGLTAVPTFGVDGSGSNSGDRRVNARHSAARVSAMLTATYLMPPHALALPCLIDVGACARIDDFVRHAGFVFTQLCTTFVERAHGTHVSATDTTAATTTTRQTRGNNNNSSGRYAGTMHVAQLMLPAELFARTPHPAHVVAAGKAYDRDVAIVLACMHAELLLDALHVCVYARDERAQKQHALTAWAYGRPAPLPGASPKHPSAVLLPLPLKEWRATTASARDNDDNSYNNNNSDEERYADDDATTSWALRQPAGRVAPLSADEVLLRCHRSLAIATDTNSAAGMTAATAADATGDEEGSRRGVAAASCVRFVDTAVCEATAIDDVRAYLQRHGVPHAQQPFLHEQLHGMVRATVVLPVPASLGVRGGVGVAHSRADAEVLAAMHALDVLTSLGIAVYADAATQARWLAARRDALSTEEQQQQQHSHAGHDDNDDDNATTTTTMRTRGGRDGTTHAAATTALLTPPARRIARDGFAVTVRVDARALSSSSSPPQTTTRTSDASDASTTATAAAAASMPRRRGAAKRARAYTPSPEQPPQQPPSHVRDADEQEATTVTMTAAAAASRDALADASSRRVDKCDDADTTMSSNANNDGDDEGSDDNDDQLTKNASSSLPSSLLQLGYTPVPERELDAVSRLRVQYYLRCRSDAMTECTSGASRVDDKVVVTYAMTQMASQVVHTATWRLPLPAYCRQRLPSAAACSSNDNAASSSSSAAATTTTTPAAGDDDDDDADVSVCVQGIASSKRDADVLSYMHAERTLDALGVPIFARLPRLQRWHAARVARAGRCAPPHASTQQQQQQPHRRLAALPPPLRLVSAAAMHEHLAPPPLPPPPPSSTCSSDDDDDAALATWQTYADACARYVAAQQLQNSYTYLASGKVPRTGCVLYDTTLDEVDACAAAIEAARRRRLQQQQASSSSSSGTHDGDDDDGLSSLVLDVSATAITTAATTASTSSSSAASPFSLAALHSRHRPRRRSSSSSSDDDDDDDNVLADAMLRLRCYCAAAGCVAALRPCAVRLVGASTTRVHLATLPVPRHAYVRAAAGVAWRRRDAVARAAAHALAMLQRLDADFAEYAAVADRAVRVSKDAQTGDGGALTSSSSSWWGVDASDDMHNSNNNNSDGGDNVSEDVFDVLDPTLLILSDARRLAAKSNALPLRGARRVLVANGSGSGSSAGDGDLPRHTLLQLHGGDGNAVRAPPTTTMQVLSRYCPPAPLESLTPLGRVRLVFLYALCHRLPPPRVQHWVSLPMLTTPEQVAREVAKAAASSLSSPTSSPTSSTTTTATVSRGETDDAYAVLCGARYRAEAMVRDDDDDDEATDVDVRGDRTRRRSRNNDNDNNNDNNKNSNSNAPSPSSQLMLRASASGGSFIGNAGAAYERLAQRLLQHKADAMTPLHTLLLAQPQLDPLQILDLPLSREQHARMQRLANVDRHLVDDDGDDDNNNNNNNNNTADDWHAYGLIHAAPDAETRAARSRALQARLRTRLANDEYVTRYAPARARLSMHAHKDELLRLVARHPVVVLCGTTGCGKTTQVPQYILDAAAERGDGGDCHILVTQPRRLSAVSIARRVAAERLERVGDACGYAVRFDQRIGTHLNFCTTGVLLRMLRDNATLRGVTHLILDEVHERDLNTDFAMLLVRRVLARRPDLRVVLMSATLQAETFSRYFGDAPVVHVRGHTHPVQEWFLDDLAAAAAQCGVVTPLLKEAALSTRNNNSNNSNGNGNDDERDIGDATTTLAGDAMTTTTTTEAPVATATQIDYATLQFAIEQACRLVDLSDASVLVFLPGWHELTHARELLGRNSAYDILLLHSSVSAEAQMRCFVPSPPGKIKVILSTNIAESGVTLDNVGAVIDVGLAKERVSAAVAVAATRPQSSDNNNNDNNNNDNNADGDEDAYADHVGVLRVCYASRASCVQRRGRVGRTRPGVCIRLYTRAHLAALHEYRTPELLRVPLDAVCLQALALGIGDVAALLREAVSPPEDARVRAALTRLRHLGAVRRRAPRRHRGGRRRRGEQGDRDEHGGDDDVDDDVYALTPLGATLAQLPLDPRTGVMVVYGVVLRCLDAALALAAAASGVDVFASDRDSAAAARLHREHLSANTLSDAVARVNGYNYWVAAHRGGTPARVMAALQGRLLHVPSLLYASHLKQQLRGELRRIGVLPPEDGDNNDGNDNDNNDDSNSKRAYNKHMYVDRSSYSRDACDVGLVKCCITAGLLPNAALARGGWRQLRTRRCDVARVSGESVLHLTASSLSTAVATTCRDDAAVPPPPRRPWPLYVYEQLRHTDLPRRVHAGDVAMDAAAAAECGDDEAAYGGAGATTQTTLSPHVASSRVVDGVTAVSLWTVLLMSSEAVSLTYASDLGLGVVDEWLHFRTTYATLRLVRQFRAAWRARVQHRLRRPRDAANNAALEEMRLLIKELVSAPVVPCVAVGGDANDTTGDEDNGSSTGATAAVAWHERGRIIDPTAAQA